MVKSVSARTGHATSCGDPKRKEAMLDKGGEFETPPPAPFLIAISRIRNLMSCGKTKETVKFYKE